MFIQYDGTNVEQLRAALNALKPTSTVEAVEDDGGIRFDQVWHDNQRSQGRWRIRPGQHLDAATGAVLDEVPTP